MPKPIIAVDLDDVLTAHHEGLISWYNQTYGTELSLADVHSTNPEVWGTATDAEAIKRVHAYFESDSFKDEKPLPGAVKVLEYLNRNYRLIVITGRDYIIELVTREWLTEHYPSLFDDVHFTAQYSLAGRSRSKTDIVESEQVSYFIDDNLFAVVDVAKAGTPSILFGNYPWNLDEGLPTNVTRCNDWAEVQAYFDA